MIARRGPFLYNCRYGLHTGCRCRPDPHCRQRIPPGRPSGDPSPSRPRRLCRGRSEDLLFLTVSACGAFLPTGLLDQLARLASDAFYGTPGSVTGGSVRPPPR
jgi:hypothetical protein